uniref:Glucagon / GIP / secretin / VIP family domain-containing protein n=1 Tax=Myotis lucifugus TaxID=59463 RepID=G1PDQ8_MYOLU
MKSIYFVAGLFVMLVQGSWQRSLQDTEEKSSSFPAPRTDSLNDLHQIHKEKRQEESILSENEERIFSELDTFLDNECLDDFFIWLLLNDENGIAKHHNEFERHAEGTFTSDISSYLEGQAAKEFIAWLVKGPGRQELISQKEYPEMVSRRHVDGSFSDEMNTNLATLEFINWLLQNKITDRK